jgi:hypothetical protein
MKTIITKAGWIVSAGAIVILGAGCKTIVRENIISAIDTGVGATLAENKQTQLYELKAGYIRSQFYSIPTGKLVENDNPDTQIVLDKNGKTVKAKISNAANITPQVVAGIRSHTGLQDILLGMDVSENFAVGEVAVNSDAATAMYISNAQKPGNATAASEAVSARQQAMLKYQKSLEQANTDGKTLQAQAAALVDKIDTAAKFKAALTAGVETGMLEQKDVDKLAGSLSDPPSQKDKDNLKTYLRSRSPERNSKLTNMVGDLQDITKAK